MSAFPPDDITKVRAIASAKLNRELVGIETKLLADVALRVAAELVRLGDEVASGFGHDPAWEMEYFPDAMDRLAEMLREAACRSDLLASGQGAKADLEQMAVAVDHALAHGIYRGGRA